MTPITKEDDMGCSCSINIDVDSNDFHSEKMVKAKKEHVCRECGRAILIGERYEYVFAKSEDHSFTVKTCSECVEIRNCFMCSWHYGRVFEYINNEIGDLNLSGLEDLSPAARELFFRHINLFEG